MNDEERQYWVNILPIMTPEQVQNLKDILDNERKQLSAIDQKYAKEIEQVGQTEFTKQVNEERTRKRQVRRSAEEDAKQQEINAAESLFDDVKNP